MFRESDPYEFSNLERDDSAAEALLAEEAARLRREKKRPFIAMLERAASRMARECLHPTDLTDLVMESLRSEPGFVKEALFEIKALQSRLTASAARKLHESQFGKAHADVAAARAVLVAAGFPSDDLTDASVHQIIDYAPLLHALSRSTDAAPF